MAKTLATVCDVSGNATVREKVWRALRSKDEHEAQCAAMAVLGAFTGELLCRGDEWSNALADELIKATNLYRGNFDEVLR